MESWNGSGETSELGHVLLPSPNFRAPERPAVMRELNGSCPVGDRVKHGCDFSEQMLQDLP